MPVMDNLRAFEPNGAIIHDAILQLVQECKCPICLEFFTVPRNAPCQHNFCEECIYEHIKDHHSECPTCRHPGVNKRSLVKNNSLENITNCVKRISVILGISPATSSTKKCQSEEVDECDADRSKVAKPVKHKGKRYGNRTKGTAKIQEDPLASEPIACG